MKGVLSILSPSTVALSRSKRPPAGTLRDSFCRHAHDKGDAL